MICPIHKVEYDEMCPACAYENSQEYSAHHLQCFRRGFNKENTTFRNTDDIAPILAGADMRARCESSGVYRGDTTSPVEVLGAAD